MKKLTQLIYATALLCSMAGCNSDPLPKPTQDGANTFGCLIDGKPLIPDGGTGFMPRKPISGGFFAISDYPIYQRGLFIRTVSKDGQEVELFINDYRPGEYQLNIDTQIMPITIKPKGAYGFYRSLSNLVYITSSKNVGKITITKSDTLTGVVSGTFEFMAGNSVGTANITNGRFDVNNRTQK
jgi:hypothetical protein